VQREKANPYQVQVPFDLGPKVGNPTGSKHLTFLIHQRHVRVLTMMVNSDIIHPCTSLKKLSYGKSIKLPEEVHHIIMLPIYRLKAIQLSVCFEHEERSL